MEVILVKVGGNILDDPAALAAFLQTFADLQGPKILVHGGGKIATDLGLKLGIEPHYVNGRRITDLATLDLVTMVYGGLINKQLVAALQSKGSNALGLTGADANLVPATRRPVAAIDYGYVGDVQSDGVNAGVLHSLLQLGLTPVLAPLTHDGCGQLLNTNADTIAQEVAKALAALATVTLVYCFEKRGVLSNPDDDYAVIPKINPVVFAALRESGVVSGGMIPKLENALEATAHGVARVIIGAAGDLEALLTGAAGTCVTMG